MELKHSFNQAAETYNKSRPSYPKPVIDWIIKKTQLKSSDHILEIAPGTGQATMSFAKKGYKIHCVELGDNLAGILKDKTKGLDVTIDVADFDLWEPTINSTDMVLCATAFHWLNPETAYKKCSELLSEKGKLVLMWHAFSTKNPLVKEAYDILFSYYPKRKWEKDINLFRREQINKSGYFTVQDFLDYEWHVEESKAAYIKGFFTQSSYLALDESLKEEAKERILPVLEKLDDIVIAEVNTTVYIGGKYE